MTASNPFDRAHAIFDEALDKLDPASWEEFVLKASDGDESLRAKVLYLLGIHMQMTDFMSRPAAAVADTQPILSGPLVGSHIGPYKLLELLGEGGMGFVYVAEQLMPVKRKVALKIIKPGLDSKQIIARFESERQVLALMEHPNIARVLDAGTTDQGRPYFVMELVRGLPITEFCDERKLTTVQRMELFKKVCQAVQHAHQKGIIHRDIKPTNVLVALHDDVVVPKVIDFGIAKVMKHDFGEHSVYTAFNQMMGTPLYMSPEQAEMNSLDVDIRSDIYSLGVLLYELITGTTPFDKEKLRLAGFDEMRRMIRETDPPRPSDRLSTLSEKDQSTASGRRSVQALTLKRAMRAELDWIVMKALEKDRTRRYETATHFADDIQRYLDGLPVSACPPTTSYKVKKLFNRHKRSIVATSLVFAAMLTAIVGLGRGMILAERARILAESREREANAATLEAKAATSAESKAKSEAIASQQAAEQASQEAREAERLARESDQDTKAFSQFLVNDILSAARPEGERGGLGIGVTLVNALDEAAKRMGTTFQDRPRAEAIAQHDLGVTYRLIGELQKAEPHLWRAWELRKQTNGDNGELTLQSLNSLAVLLNALGRDKEALSLHERIVKLQKSRPASDEDPNTYLYIRNLASAYYHDHRLQLALYLCEEGYRGQKRLLAYDDDALLHSMSCLGTIYVAAGKVEEGLSLLKEAFASQAEKLGRGNPETLAKMVSLARGYENAQQFDLAIPLFLEAIVLSKAKLGVDHPDTLSAMFHLAHTINESGRPHEALELFEENLNQRRRALGDERAQTLDTMNSLGKCLHDLKRHEEAEKIYVELVPIAKRTLGIRHPTTEAAMANLLEQYVQLKKRTMADALEAELSEQHQQSSPKASQSDDEFQEGIIQIEAGWAVFLPGTYFSKMVGDSAGNHYLVGTFSREAVFGNVKLAPNSNGNSDVFVAKQNADGQFLWAVRCGNPSIADVVQNAAIDSSGNVFIVGRFSDSAQFGAHSITSAGDKDGFVAKINGDSGEFLWARQIGGIGKDSSNGIAMDPTGDVVITGGFDADASSNRSDAPELYVTKMSTNGFLQWTKSVTGQAVYMPQCLAIDSNGAIYIGGRFRGTAEFTKGAISSLANLPNESGLLASDGFVSKLDSQGNWLWTVALPSNTYCVANCVAVGPDHNISLSASFQGIVNIGSSSFESAGSFDILLFQLDSKTGSVNWANRVGGSSGSDLCGGIAFDDDGNINVIGTFADRVVFGNQTLSADGKSTNCFWSKLTSGGNFLDSRRIVSAANILSSGIHFDAVGNGYFVGSAFGSSPVRLPQRQVQSRLGGGYAFKLPITRENVLSNPTRKPSAQ